MNNKARGFLPVVVIIAVAAIILKIAFSQFIRLTTNQNESRAQEQLRLLSVAMENFAKDNMGSYPRSMQQLTQSQPPYMGEDIIASGAQAGYRYACERMESLGYRCSAQPQSCGVTGRYTYTVSTGGPFQAEKCSQPSE